MLSIVCCLEGGAPVGGGGGGGRLAPVGEYGGTLIGIGGIPRFSRESPVVSSGTKEEFVGKAGGVFGDIAEREAGASEFSSPDSEPGLGDRIGG